MNAWHLNLNKLITNMLADSGASLTSLYKESSTFGVYQPGLNINSIIYNVTVIGGLKVRTQSPLHLLNGHSSNVTADKEPISAPVLRFVAG